MSQPQTAAPTPPVPPATVAEPPALTPVEMMKAFPKGSPAEKSVMANGGRFNERGQKQLEYALIAEAGHTIDDLLKPSYWRHVAPLLKPLTKISVMADDQSFYCELIVFEATTVSAAVLLFGEPIIVTDRTKLALPSLDLEVFHGGLHKQWCVRLKSTGRILRDSLPTDDAARAWLRDYTRAQKPAA